MVKNKLGGNKAKKGASKNNIENIKIELPDCDQYYGFVTKILGCRRFNIDYYIPTIISKEGEAVKIDWMKFSKQGSVRPKMRKKKIWVNLNDIVLVTERDFDDNIDIINKYNPQQITYLKKHSHFPDLNSSKKIDMEFVFEDTNDKEPKKEENKNKNKNQKNKPYVDFSGMPSYSDDEIDDI